LNDQEQSRLRSAVFALLGVVLGLSLLGTVLAPYLLVKNPLLLVTISPAAHHVALAAATVEPVPLVAVATARRVMTGMAAYGLGFLYGRAALGWLEKSSPRLASFAGWVERLFARWGVWLLVLAPAPTVALFAGAARSRFVAFVVAVTLGHGLWICATVFVGDALAVWTDRLTGFLGEYLFESTAVCVALVVLQHVLSRRRRRSLDLPVPPP
jgi:membrane protein YqaA with SNARE-associated domain